MAKKKKRPGFFGDIKEEKWREEWQGMPEFIQEDQESFKSIIVHFENQEDMDNFAKLAEQRITLKTQSIWYPKANIARVMNKIYIDKKRKKIK